VFYAPLHALFRSRHSKLRWVHFGNCVGMTKGFAGSSPSKGGDDGSAHILVLAAECHASHDHSVFDPAPNWISDQDF
jgi:hypothetical protein